LGCVVGVCRGGCRSMELLFEPAILLVEGVEATAFLLGLSKELFNLGIVTII
jgi:hypothetical protein